MLINEACNIREIEIIDGTKIPSNETANIERNILNKTIGANLPNIDNSERSQEIGLILVLYSERTKKEYKRFMPESLLRDSVYNRDASNMPPLKKEDLVFFAEKLKNRKHPLFITIFDSDIENLEYQNVTKSSNDNKETIKIVGTPRKKGEKKNDIKD